MEPVKILCSQHILGADPKPANTELLVVAGSGAKFIATLSGPGHETIRCESATMQDGCDTIEAKFREIIPNHICSQGCRSWQRMPVERRTNRLQ